MAERLDFIGARVPREVKNLLAAQAKEEGKTLSNHARDVLARHALGINGSDHSTKNPPPEPKPAIESEVLKSLTSAMRALAERVTEVHAADRSERSDYYAAHANLMEGVLRSGARDRKTTFSEAEATEFVSRSFRKRLLGEGS